MLGQPSNFLETEVCLVFIQKVKNWSKKGWTSSPSLESFGFMSDTQESGSKAEGRWRLFRAFAGWRRAFHPGSFLTAGGGESSSVQPRSVHVIAFGPPLGPPAIQGQSLCFQKFLSKEAISQTDLLSFCKQQITQENVITHSLCY